MSGGPALSDLSFRFEFPFTVSPPDIGMSGHFFSSGWKFVDNSGRWW